MLKFETSYSVMEIFTESSMTEEFSIYSPAFPSIILISENES